MTLLIVVIVLAFIFDYINGFHDAANSIASGSFYKSINTISSRAMSSIF
jgi:PiT family inorganic phosphate transporter